MLANANKAPVLFPAPARKTLFVYDSYHMSTQEVLLQFVRGELELARTLLQVAATEMAHPADPEGAERAIARARAAIKEARRFLSKLNVSDAERTSIEAELSSLEKNAQDQPRQP